MQAVQRDTWDMNVHQCRDEVRAADWRTLESNRPSSIMRAWTVVARRSDARLTTHGSDRLIAWQRLVDAVREIGPMEVAS